MNFIQLWEKNILPAENTLIHVHVCFLILCFLFFPSVLTMKEFRQKVMLGTPFVVIWLVGFIADLDVDSWLIKGIMYAGVWIAVQFLSKYVPTKQLFTVLLMQFAVSSSLFCAQKSDYFSDRFFLST